MANRSWNLLLRFILELAALAAIGFWGWLNYGWLAAICAPVVIAGLWGVFAVPGDPSRSGHAPVPIPGWLRLIFELAVLYGATWALTTVDYTMLATGLGVAITFHYAFSYDRIAWLVER